MQGKKRRIGVISLGCAKNRVNTEQMMWLLRQAGFNVSGETNGTDAVLINTCAFIDSAKTEAIETILEIAEEKAAGKTGAIIVAGCLPERYKDEIIKEIPEIDGLIGTGSFDEIASITEKVLKSKDEKADIGKINKETNKDINKKTNKKTNKKVNKKLKTKTPDKKAPVILFKDKNTPVSEAERIITTSPVWAYLKIAEGCDNRCAYCTIPDIRGRYRSRPIDNILKEAKQLAENGYIELNLVAQDTTAYGTDMYKKRSLTRLLKELSEIEKIKWIRLLYMYPDGFDDTLIDEIAKNDKIVKYLDIPIQHISDIILQKMNRRGSSRDIKNVFTKLREEIPDIVLRTSIITGLPFEGKKEFGELCDFLKEFKIERTGIFEYSPQEGTPAAAYKHPGKKTTAQRAKIIQDIQTDIIHKYNINRIGQELAVLIDGQYARSYAEAPEADGYIKIINPEKVQPDTLARGKITDYKDGHLYFEGNKH